MMTRNGWKPLMAAAVALGLSACTTVPVRSTSPEDNPQHHYVMGMKALEEGNAGVAQEKFQRAVYLDEEYSKGYAGLALVGAERVRGQSDAAFRSIETERMQENLTAARKKAETADDSFDYLLAAIRTGTSLKPKGWIPRAENAWREALEQKIDERTLIYYQGTEAAHYYMGLAYLEGLEFQKARDRFTDVLNAKREGKWHEKADVAWKKTDRIVQAMAGITVGDVGRAIAVKDAVSRADLAALLVDELKIDRIMAGRIPVASQVAAMKAEFTPADILSNPFREEVLTLMKWKVRGMEPRFDDTTKAYLFKPTDSVSRGEMALILEDVLVKLTADEKLARAYLGQENSPFPDIKPTSAVYNAAMNMTTRGIMRSELSGEFRPAAPVDGADALLALRMLKQRVNIY